MFPSECSKKGVSIYICLQANKFVHWVNKQSFVLKVNVEHFFCVPGEIDFQNHVYIVYFSCTQVLEIRKKGQHSELM